MKNRAKKIADHLLQNYRFKGGRPITAAEVQNRLPTDKPSRIPVAWPQLSVIRMNSTYLECANFLFGRQGLGTIGGAAGLFIFGYMYLGFIFITIERWTTLTGSRAVEEIFFLGFMLLLLAPVLALIVFLLKLETFTLTHFPMRFNRKTRMVHVFLEFQKGRILSIPWDDVFFTCTSLGGPKVLEGGSFSVVGFQMSEDGKTVQEAFELAHRSSWDSEYRFLQWEFIRQYMEGDDATLRKLADMVDEVQDVAERRETLVGSFRRSWATLAGSYLWIFVLLSPFILLMTLGRQIAMWTSKIPRWPADIEATCQYPANDPLLRDAKHLAPRAIPPDVSGYAGR
jgi:hypothetical protein